MVNQFRWQDKNYKNQFGFLEGKALANEENGSVDHGSISLLIPPTRNGDPKAREELMRELKSYLESTAKRHMDYQLQSKTGSSDIVQQSFLQIIEKFEQFRGQNSRELRGWIETIVINEIGRTRRKFHTAKRDAKREKLDSDFLERQKILVEIAKRLDSNLSNEQGDSNDLSKEEIQELERVKNALAFLNAAKHDQVESGASTGNENKQTIAASAQDTIHGVADDLVDDDQIRPNESIGRFEVKRLIGQGGFAKVYLARDPKRPDFATLDRISF